MRRDALDAIVKAIDPIDAAWEARAWIRLDSLTKPPRSLGRLESAAARIAAIQRTTAPEVRPAAVTVFAADHGVAARGVSAYPQEVTAQMVENFARGGAAINHLSKAAGAQLVVVDVGVASTLSDAGHVRVEKVRLGTADMTQGPAMSVEDAIAAIQAGYGVVGELVGAGVRTIAIGEMGIGNTTAAAALTCAYTGLEPQAVVGPGTGLDARGLAHKISVVEQALSVNRNRFGDPLTTLAAVGGLEIAAMAGAILGAAAHRAVPVIDGFISSAAALAAVRLSPLVAGYVIASHRSKEPGHQAVLDALGAQPLLDLDLRLGEGTGAALGLMLLHGACAVMNGMATFEEAGVSGTGRS